MPSPPPPMEVGGTLGGLYCCTCSQFWGSPPSPKREGSGAASGPPLVLLSQFVATQKALFFAMNRQCSGLPLNFFLSLCLHMCVCVKICLACVHTPSRQRSKCFAAKPEVLSTPRTRPHSLGTTWEGGKGSPTRVALVPPPSVLPCVASGAARRWLPTHQALWPLPTWH